MITDLFAGRVGFSRDSRGYLASQLTLTRYGGHAVSPQFTMNTDNDSTEQGWYLDDIRVYTCGRAPVPRSECRPSAPGSVVEQPSPTDSYSASTVRATSSRVDPLRRNAAKPGEQTRRAVIDGSVLTL